MTATPTGRRPTHTSTWPFPSRRSLSPEEVEQWESEGFEVKVLSISSMENGKRWCTVSLWRANPDKGNLGNLGKG